MVFLVQRCKSKTLNQCFVYSKSVSILPVVITPDKGILSCCHQVLILGLTIFSKLSEQKCIFY